MAKRSASCLESPVFQSMPVELMVRIVIAGMTNESVRKRDVDVVQEHAFYCSLLPLSKAYYAEANNERSWYQLARFRCARYVGTHAFQPAEGGHFEIAYGVANGGELTISDQKGHQHHALSTQKKKKSGAASNNKDEDATRQSARQRAEARRRSEFLPERSYRDFCFALDAGVRLERLLDADDFLGNEGYIFRALGYGQWCTMACFGVPLNKKGETELSLNNAFFEAAPHVANIFEDSVGEEEEGEAKEDRIEFDDGQQGSSFIDCFADSDESEESDEGSGEGSDGGGNEKKKDDEKAKGSKRARQLEALAKKLAAFPRPVVYARGNHSNCDTLCDGLYVTYGTALGGVLIYKSW